MPSSAKQKTSSRSASKPITDPRFASIQTDPRYRLPSRKNNRVQLDKRFSRVLTDDAFSRKASVDRYGRKIAKGTGRKELERFYRLDQGPEEDKDAAVDESGDDDDEVQEELARVNRRTRDPAREGGFSDSSSSSSDEDSGSDSDSDEGDLGRSGVGGDEAAAVAASEAGLVQGPGRQNESEEVPLGEVSRRLAVVNLDWDHIRAVDLMAVASSFCPAGGRIQKVTVYPSEFGRERMEQEELEGPPRELFKSNSNNNGGGSGAAAAAAAAAAEVEDNDSEEEEEEENEDDEEIRRRLLADQTDAVEVDTKALRAYQLSRLRYYYAVLEADSDDTAHRIYSEMDGREYLSTSNFFDLRFVPDEVSFDADRPRDECTSVPRGYKPADFVTEALTHSKVRLTWDEEDRGRQEAQKRAFSQKEIDDNDLQWYIGSDSSDDDDDDDDGGEEAAASEPATATTTTNARSTSKSKSDSKAAAYRALLGLAAPSSSSSKSGKKAPPEHSGGMQITFAPGLSAAAARDSIFENTPEDAREETTREKYIRKERERKARRKAKAKSGREGAQPNEAVDVDDDDDDDDDDGAPSAQRRGLELPVGDDEEVSASDEDDIDDGSNITRKAADPFDDPFFADPEAANAASRRAAKKAERADKAARLEAEAESERRRAEQLEMIMADGRGGEDDATGSSGAGAVTAEFDMKELRRAEKAAARAARGKGGKRGKGSKSKGNGVPNEQGGVNGGPSSALPVKTKTTAAADNFDVDVEDPRFKGMYESLDFAIDPNDPRFSGTSGMKRLLEEGRKKRKRQPHRQQNRDPERRGEEGGGSRHGGGGEAGRKAEGKGDNKKKQLGFGGDEVDVDALVAKMKRRKV